jgi:hypothetical protein
MPMFKPPAEWLYRSSLRSYELRFRRQVPQWVQTLGREEARSLLHTSTKLGWKLPPKILVAGEEQSGSESLWAERQTRLDVVTEIKNRGRFRPKDLQDLPFDPALAAVKGSARKQNQ